MGGERDPVGGDAVGGAGEEAQGGASTMVGGTSNGGGTVGGSSGSGGSGGTMPVECRPDAIPTVANECGKAPWPAGDGAHFLIENFEDKNTTLELLDDREGAWAFVTDGTGTTLPDNPASLLTATGGADGTASSLRVKGQGFSLWGAVLILPFRGVCPYDASAYGGIEFWAKGSGKLAAELRDEATTAAEFGGVCVNETDVQCCEDYHAKLITLSPDWQKFSFKWTALQQAGTGYEVPFDPSKLVGLSLNSSGADFDLWIDQVAFIAKEP